MVDSQTQSGTTDMQAIEARMPASIATQNFTAALGRTFACPECGAPSQGECPECGHTHQEMRADPDGGAE